MHAMIARGIAKGDVTVRAVVVEMIIVRQTKFTLSHAERRRWTGGGRGRVGKKLTFFSPPPSVSIRLFVEKK